MPRMYLYVSGTDKEHFEVYAAQLGLDATALSNLLLERELRVGRLESLGHRGCEGRRDAKIIARMTDSRGAEFAALAKRHGLSVSEAGAVLVLVELEERWLEKAVDNM